MDDAPVCELGGVDVVAVTVTVLRHRPPPRRHAVTVSSILRLHLLLCPASAAAAFTASLIESLMASQCTQHGDPSNCNELLQQWYNSVHRRRAQIV